MRIVMAAVSSVAMAAPGGLLAPASQAQLQAAATALNSAPPALKADAQAAMPTLRPYILTLMCVKDDTATVGLIQKYVGSRGHRDDRAVALGRTQEIVTPDDLGGVCVYRCQIRKLCDLGPLEKVAYGRYRLGPAAAPVMPERELAA